MKSPGLTPTVTDDDAGDSGARPPVQETEALARGAVLGRYVVVDRLGEGGMGIVYAAYDPELDRKLAVKLLRDHGLAGPDRRARLLREAQALARLHHPNVVAVYDVGTIGERVFIAMELVAGQTVSAWLAEAKRDWRAIVDVYLQAGRGLAAAHELGIVHRDFKPENVLVDRHGRVRVVDFGLARAAQGGDTPEPADDSDGEPGTRGTLSASLTRTGAFVGTPGYIAPEQLQGKTSASVDQFSFCVSLWKALYGELPFAGGSAIELAESARKGALRSPPRDTRAPAWLHRALRRGLAAEPERRFASMQQLLGLISRRRARRTYAIAAAIAVPLVVAGGAGLYAARPEQPHVCRGADRQLAGIWDGERRTALANAFAATKLPYVAAATAGVTEMFDTYAASWIAMRTEACEATRVRGEQSEELLDLRMECLDDRARDLRALSDVFVHADNKAVERWYQAAQALPPVSACADAVALKAPVRLPARPDVRARIVELRVKLAEARALDTAGKFADAQARATAILTEARTLKFRPLEATALTVLGIAQRDAGDYKSARASLEQAVLAATAGRDDASAAEASAWLVRLVGYDLAKGTDGDPWIARAEALLEAQPDDQVKATLENNIGVVRFGEGLYDDALVHHRAGLALRQRLYGDKSPLVAASLDNIGLCYDFKGDAAQGVEYHRRALAIDTAALGDVHPAVALTLANLAVSLRQLGELDEALKVARRGLELKEKLYGPESMMVSVSLNEVGNIYFLQHRWPEALQVYQRALEIKKKTVGPDHPLVPGAMSNVGIALEAMHRYDEALAMLREALALKIKVDGPDHLDVGNSYSELGHLALTRKQWAEALAQYRMALATWQKSQEPGTPLIATAQHGIGEAELGAGHLAAAIAAFEIAHKIRTEKQVDIVDRAVTLYDLAKAYDASGERAKAIPLAEQASELYKQAGARASDDHTEVEAWLAARRN